MYASCKTFFKLNFKTYIKYLPKLNILNFFQGSSPECCAETASWDNGVSGTPAPPPGPRYTLATEGPLRVCSFQHTRTVVDKILAAKFLRRWETRVLALEEEHIAYKSVSLLYLQQEHTSLDQTENDLF